MQIVGSYPQCQSPDIVDASLKVLHVYSQSQNDERSNQEELLVSTAANCIRDYILGVGRFSPPPPKPCQEMHQVSTSDYQTVAHYLEALAIANQGRTP